MKEELAKKWEKGADFYNRNFYSFNKKQWEHLVAPYLNDEPGIKSILDVGTGPGQLALLLASMGHEVTGLDLSKRMIELANQHNEEARHKATFLEGNAEYMHFLDNSFHLITNRLNLWTLPNPGLFVQQAYRVLKTNGKILLFITMPDSKKVYENPQTNKKEEIFTEDYQKAVAQLPFRNASPAQVKALLDAAGFKETVGYEFNDERTFTAEHMADMLSDYGEAGEAFQQLLKNHPSKDEVESFLQKYHFSHGEVHYNSEGALSFVFPIDSAMITGRK
ncbi:class I SAM-dependent methyltransferase [Marinococcus luteus]|uniref:class I SAM-dependent methyltransferase n=1 Tax=Marinococcus luteus TaxID=1122204 RepID=UPI002ACC3EEB|nr:class I SAM-dependent methyltransferase [Marinococcus luteus]MDZ5783136.1 class I SAM-dependent methyltransferase [Marinococcus luteus]